jgi:hypothetical protein
MLSLHIKPSMSIKIGSDTIEILNIKPKSYALVKNGDAISAINLNQTYQGKTVSDENKIVSYNITFYANNKIRISAPSSVQIVRSNAIKKGKRL